MFALIWNQKQLIVGNFPWFVEEEVDWKIICMLAINSNGKELQIHIQYSIFIMEFKQFLVYFALLKGILVYCSATEWKLEACRPVYTLNNYTFPIIIVIIVPGNACGLSDSSDSSTLLRLNGLLSPMIGRLEICFNQTWSAVIAMDNAWTLQDSTVVCRSLGYQKTININLAHERYFTCRIAENKLKHTLSLFYLDWHYVSIEHPGINWLALQFYSKQFCYLMFVFPKGYVPNYQRKKVNVF